MIKMKCIFCGKRTRTVYFDNSDRYFIECKRCRAPGPELYLIFRKDNDERIQVYVNLDEELRLNVNYELKETHVYVEGCLKAFVPYCVKVDLTKESVESTIKLLLTFQ